MSNHPPTSSAKPTVLARLRTAVDKLRLLLRHLPTSSSPWPLLSTLYNPHPPRRLTLTDRQPSGLTDAFLDDDTSEPEHYYEARSASSSVASSPVARVLHRAGSSLDSTVAGGEDGDVEDIDRKADDFIEKFYRQLRLEKQVSLELRYCRGQSFGSSSIIDSPSSNPSLSSPTS